MPDERARQEAGGPIGTFSDVPEPGSEGFLGAVVLLVLDAELEAERQSRVGLRSSFWEQQGGLDRLLNAHANRPLPARFQALLDRRYAGELDFVQWRYGDEPE